MERERANNDDADLRQLFFLILQGLAYLHDRGVVHANLTLDNILLDQNTRPVIVGFDLCTSSSVDPLVSIRRGSLPGSVLFLFSTIYPPLLPLTLLRHRNSQGRLIFRTRSSCWLTPYFGVRYVELWCDAVHGAGWIVA